jgi:putative two-component system response regulator
MAAASFPAERTSILVVDDISENLTLMAQLLKDTYQVRVANSGEKALRIVRGANPPDLILLDVMMPGMSGHDVCSELKSDPATSEIPVIFVTAMSETEDEEKGFALGAVDYITKPISPPIVRARVKAQLQLKAIADFLKDKAAFLEGEVAIRTRQVVAVQDVAILALASLAETRDNETGSHIRRTQHYVRALALKVCDLPKFAASIPPHRIDVLFKSAPLHDIGKVGIPDRILLKPGRLNPDEYEVMKTHAVLGRDAIAHAELQLGTDVEFLACAKEIAWAHHERWDGKGYPRGIAGDEIPVSARLMAIADVFDALTSKRVYKEGMAHEKAVQIIAEGRGTQFDPDLVDAFLEIGDEFQAISARFQDSDVTVHVAAEPMPPGANDGQAGAPISG